MALSCEHGRLKRSCNECSLALDVPTLQAVLRELIRDYEMHFAAGRAYDINLAAHIAAARKALGE